MVSTREPAIENVTGWTPGKMWCDSTGGALPLTLPVLVIENDVGFPDELEWTLETLVTLDGPVVRGPFTLDETFFSSAYGRALAQTFPLSTPEDDPAGSEAIGSGSWSDGLAESSWSPEAWPSNASGFWNADMPDVAFRVVGGANGSFIFRPCPESAPPLDPHLHP